jgi:DNA-binding MarR family transcriptional regulator
MRTNESARDALIDRVMERFDAFMHRIAATHAHEFTEVGMTMAQAKLLYHVQSATALRMSELATRLGVAISTTSGLVDRLVDAGLLDRKDDPADRRQVVVTLTGRGTATLDRMRELNAAHLRRMLDHVSDADLTTIERAIRILGEAAMAISTATADPPATATADPPRTTTANPPSHPTGATHRKDQP